MDPKKSVRAIFFFLIGVVVLWGALAWGLPQLENFNSPAPRNEGTEIDESPTPVVTPIVLVHSEEKDVHTYSGTVELPTPCHNLMTTLTVGGTSRASAQIMLRVTTDPLAICTQVITPVDFEVSLTSAVVPAVTLLLNEREVPVSVVEGD